MPTPLMYEADSCAGERTQYKCSPRLPLSATVASGCILMQINVPAAGELCYLCRNIRRIFSSPFSTPFRAIFCYYRRHPRKTRGEKANRK